MEPIIQLNSEAKLSDHFTLGEMTKSNSHPEVYNIPSRAPIQPLGDARRRLPEQESPQGCVYPSVLQIKKNTLLHVDEAGCFGI